MTGGWPGPLWEPTLIFGNLRIQVFQETHFFVFLEASKTFFGQLFGHQYFLIQATITGIFGADFWRVSKAK